jgi:hypothetical protein
VTVFVDRRAFFRSLGGALRDEAAPLAPAARPAARLATAAELAGLAVECGLRLDDVRALARTSVRLTPARERTGSFVGGDADLALDLADVARAAGTGHGLPAEGVLWCFRDRVAVRPGRAQGSVPVSLSAELVLPRRWAAPVQALGLSEAETLGWEELRARLAALQGVEPPPAPDHVMRVLGYPEDRNGEMPALCEKRSGVPSERWRLLAQLPADAGRRLFVWVPGPGDLGRAVAFVR